MILYGIVVYVFIKQKAFDKINHILKLWMSTEVVTFVIEFVLIEAMESSLMGKAEAIRMVQINTT